MWWNSVVKLWEYQCRSVFRCVITSIIASHGAPRQTKECHLALATVPSNAALYPKVACLFAFFCFTLWLFALVFFRG
jgi:hypothetical protein